MEDDNKNIRIVTNLENTSLSDENQLFIVKRELKSDIFDYYIAYKNVNSPVETRVGFGKRSPKRAIFCSELIQKLKQKKWFVPEKRYIDDINSEDFDVRLSIRHEDSLNPIYKINPIKLYYGGDGGEVESMSLVTSPEVTYYKFNKLWEQAFNIIKDPDKRQSIKTQIENMATTGEIYLYNSSKKVIDILEGNDLINLVEYNSDIYTNTIDLSTILNERVCNNETSVKVDLSVQYSKNSTIYNQDITFEGFSIKDDKLVSQNFSQKINNEVVVEYLNGIVRVIPITSDILECIISNCTVIYGKLGK